MGASLRKELFGDDSDSDINSVTGGEEEIPADAAQSNRKAASVAIKTYEKFLIDQEDYIEDGEGKKRPLKRPRGENRPYDKTASDILYQLCAYTEVTAEQTTNLLQLGANPNYVAKGNHGNRMLHMLARRGVSPSAVYALLAAGGTAHSVNRFNQTPLMLACDTVRTGQTLEIVKILCREKKGLNLELRDLGGNSALLNTIYKSNPWVCRELLLAGASAVQGEPAAFHVALWVFSESLAQDLEKLPRELYEGDTCCLPGCPLGSPALDYTGSCGWFRVMLQGLRMPDFEIVMRMVFFRKDLEHMFDVPRREDLPTLSPAANNRKILKPIGALPAILGEEDGQPTVSGPLGLDICNDKENDEIKCNTNSNYALAIIPTSHVKASSKSEFLLKERERRLQKRSDRKNKIIEDRKKKREIEERKRLEVKFIDIKQSIEETYCHSVAPRRKSGKDIWSRAPSKGGRWTRPDGADITEY